MARLQRSGWVFGLRSVTQIWPDGLNRCPVICEGGWVEEGSWGYRLLVVDDPDGNQLFFNYPKESASGKIVGNEA